MKNKPDKLNLYTALSVITPAVASAIPSLILGNGLTVFLPQWIAWPAAAGAELTGIFIVLTYQRVSAWNRRKRAEKDRLPVKSLVVAYAIYLTALVLSVAMTSAEVWQAVVEVSLALSGLSASLALSASDNMTFVRQERRREKEDRQKAKHDKDMTGQDADTTGQNASMAGQDADMAGQNEKKPRPKRRKPNPLENVPDWQNMTAQELAATIKMSERHTRRLMKDMEEKSNGKQQ